MAHITPQSGPEHWHRYVANVRAPADQVARLASDIIMNRGEANIALVVSQLMVYRAVRIPRARVSPLELFEPVTLPATRLTFNYFLGCDDSVMLLGVENSPPGRHRNTSAPKSHLQLSGGTILADPRSPRTPALSQSAEQFNRLWTEPSALPERAPVVTLNSDLDSSMFVGSMVLMDIQLTPSTT